MGQPVIAYLRVESGSDTRQRRQVERFAEAVDLDIIETYSDEGSSSEAFGSVFRMLAEYDDRACSILIPSLTALGRSRREVRGRLAALRELGCGVYEAESGMHITWATRHPVITADKQLEERTA